MACADIPCSWIVSPPRPVVSLAGEPIAQLVTRTNSLFRLSLFLPFPAVPLLGGRRWRRCCLVAREMAERVLRLGRKAEVDKRPKWNRGSGVWKRVTKNVGKEGDRRERSARRTRREAGNERGGCWENVHANAREVLPRESFPTDEWNVRSTGASERASERVP